MYMQEENLTDLVSCYLSLSYFIGEHQWLLLLYEKCDVLLPTPLPLWLLQLPGGAILG